MRKESRKNPLGYTDESIEESDLVSGYRLLSAELLGLGCLALLSVFGNPVPRIWQSMVYIGECASHIFGSLFLNGSVPEPSAPNFGEDYFSVALSNLKDFAYLWQNAVGCLFNGSVATEWGYSFLNGLADGTKWVLWLPALILFLMIVYDVSISYHKTEKAGKTKALRRFDSGFLNGWAASFLSYAENYLDFINQRYSIRERGEIEIRSPKYYLIHPEDTKHSRAYFNVDPVSKAERELSPGEYVWADFVKDGGGVDKMPDDPSLRSFVLGSYSHYVDYRYPDGTSILDRNGNRRGTTYNFDYSDRHGKAWLWALAAAFLVFSRLGLCLVDFVAWYYDFIYTWALMPFLTLTASVIVDLANFAKSVGPFGGFLVGCYAFVLYERSEGIDKIKSAQKTMDDFEDKTTTIAEEITGAPITGKTSLMTQLTIDFEAKMREDALQTMRESEEAFPLVDWQECLKWYDIHSARRLGRARIVNRGQLEKAVAYLYARWEKDPSKGFFGADPTMPRKFWDGCEEYTLLSAVKDYLSAFQLYSVMGPLVNSNYSMSFFDTRKGHYFFSYDKRDDYIKRNSRSRSAFSRIASYDSMRWKEPFDRFNSARSLADEGGGVTAFTELALEMPNRYEQNEANGKKKKKSKRYDGESEDGYYDTDEDKTYKSPIADGTVLTLRVLRHPYMIHNHCFVYLLFDTQKPGSVPDSIEGTIENHTHIVKAFDPDNTLPFWDTIGGIAYFVETAWEKYDLEYKKNRRARTVGYRLLQLSALPFIRFYKRMGNLYGYHKISIVREAGATATTSGETTKQVLYIINRHVYGAFQTNCFSETLENLTMDLNTGAADAQRYGGLEMSQSELSLQGSRTLDEIMRAVNKNADGKSARIKLQAIYDSL